MEAASAARMALRRLPSDFCTTSFSTSAGIWYDSCKQIFFTTSDIYKMVKRWSKSINSVQWNLKDMGIVIISICYGLEK